MSNALSAERLYDRIISTTRYCLSLADKVENNFAAAVARTFSQPSPPPSTVAGSAAPTFPSFADEFDAVMSSLTRRLETLDDQVMAYGDRL